MRDALIEAIAALDPRASCSIPLLGLILLVAGAAAQDAPDIRAEPKRHRTSAEAQAEFRLDPGLRIELVAAEPQVESPVAMAFDEDGRLWVVEMPDYPNGPPPGQPPQGKLRVLDDEDGDGRYETSSVFAEGLLFANGVLPWRRGALVTAAPYIIALEDTDGDGKADRREVLFEGFTAKNPQLRVSHPNLGIDNWVYVANGLRGGQIRRAGREGVPPIDLNGMDFRFDPVGDRHEAISGMGQFGLTFDDWGRRFVCDNRHHLRHVVLPFDALKRNPFLAVPDVLQDVPEEEVGAGGGGVKLYPLSKNWTTSSLHTGRFTAACGVFLYRGDLLPERYRGSAFTCDPTGNLVHQEVLRPDGASFRSSPPRKGVEFLASPDDRFRPVFLAHGPDGAMYVVDMARAVIEHPEFMPTELKERPDLTVGKDRGRIWRIVPEGHRASPARPQLGRATTAELVALLGHPNAWWRTTAQRLLLERHDPAAADSLRECLAGPPLARLHAAWLLEALGLLDPDAILALLGDDQPGLRENGVILAERRLAESGPLRGRLRAMATDPDPRVRFQVALSLGAWDDDRVLEPLATIAMAGVGDRWTRLAVASAVPRRSGALIGTLLKADHGLTTQLDPNRLVLLRELSALVGARRDPGEVAGALESLLALDGADASRWQRSGVEGVAEGMGRRGTSLSRFLKELPEAAVEPSRAGRLVERFDALLTQAAVLSEDSGREVADRLDAIRLLTHAPWPVAGPVLGRLLADDPAQEIRLAAARAVAVQPLPEAGRMLMASWPAATPALRREILAAMLRQPDRVGLLLDGLEDRRLTSGDLDAPASRLLVNHARPEIRDRARKLLQGNLPEERRQVLDRYKAAVDLAGDSDRGRDVFRTHCATCHRVAGVGVDVGPDIGDTRVKTREALLADILNPNGAIDGNYLNYVVSTRDGRVVNGLIVAESASSLTLRRAEGQADVVLRQDIDEIRSTGTSLMPEGLEKNVSIEQMADLLTFLKNWRYVEGEAAAVAK